MAIELRKVSAGERINLSKEQAGLKKFKIGLSWDVKDGVVADLDASLVILGANEKMLSRCSYLVCIKWAEIDFKTDANISHAPVNSIK